MDYGRKLKRLWLHLVYPILPSSHPLPPTTVVMYAGDLLFYILDLFFLREVYRGAHRLFKKSVRQLTSYEKALLSNFYGSKLNVENILVDNKASIMAKKHHFAYVAFDMINYWDSLYDHILVHEAMHVYQYRKYGMVYIFRSLWAQRTAEAYHYGGFNGLQRAKNLGKKLKEFNFEQQATIIEHYFIVLNRSDLRANKTMVACYQHFFDQL